MRVRSYRDLSVWQKAMDMVETCYRVTESFPGHQQFGLTSQVQRAAVSVPANIAEGHGRQTTGDYLRHLAMARGSLTELETHVQIAARLRYLDAEAAERLLAATSEIGKMLNGLITSLRKGKDPDRPIKAAQSEDGSEP
jgi:four helix bundle protein